MSDGKFGICVAGLGVLSNTTIGPAFANSEHCRLAGVVTSSEDKGRDWQKRFGDRETAIYSFADYDRIADNPDIDGVFIVLPNAQHAEYTVRAAKAGKHVICEKPLAMTVAECDQMIAACKDAGTTLATAYRCHCVPAHQELIRLAQSGELGTIRMVEASFGFHTRNPDAAHSKWRRTKADAGGGALVDVGIYALQGACYVTGEKPVEVRAMETKMLPETYGEVDETLCWTMRFPSGVIANCSTSYTCPINRLFVSGDKGWAELSPAYGYFDDITLRTQDGEKKFAPCDHFAAQMDHFALSSQGETDLLFPGEMGRRDVHIMAAIYESAASGKPVSTADC